MWLYFVILLKVVIPIKTDCTNVFNSTYYGLRYDDYEVYRRNRYGYLITTCYITENNDAPGNIGIPEYKDYSKFEANTITININNTIESLDLSNNNISNIDETFGAMNELKTIILSKNNIRNISHAFMDLEQLEILDLSYNKLTTIEFATFIGLQNLKFLNISHNNIVVNDGFLEGMPNLQQLDISFNNMNELNVNIFKPNSLKKIYIHGNKFSCNKLMHYVKYFMKMHILVGKGSQRKGLHRYGIKCEYDPTVYQEDIFDITTENIQEVTVLKNKNNDNIVVTIDENFLNSIKTITIVLIIMIFMQTFVFMYYNWNYLIRCIKNTLKKYQRNNLIDQVELSTT
ncbi:leucine-rich repeat transmembrane neuronal protein 3-like [Atheta coriaria]|uniref:leucine-rich repeat transmembrane neuronal protein 3-like n=1 Tax=Dalotia coriaria TaxID=877792 RepID=UPI0031F33994